MKPSRKLTAAIKLSETPQYRIAIAAGVHPDSLSKLINGAVRVHDNHPRIIAVGKVLGIPAEECFDMDHAKSA